MDTDGACLNTKLGAKYKDLEGGGDEGDLE